MKNTNTNARLLLPALRGSMGDWIYYLSAMRMSDIAVRVKAVGDIHETKTLSDYIQRALQAGHSELIQNYLLTQPQRLFGALVVGVYGGAPEWNEISVQKVEEISDDELEELKGILGFLSLRGTEELFAIDGQHRVVGIQKALQTKKELADEEVAVLFVAHSKDAQGTERTRRLFTVLNRHAKAVSKMELIALDDDDVVAIITRRLIDEYPLFQDKIYIKKTKNLPVSDQTSVTSIVALYDGLDNYFKGKGWTAIKRSRPTDEVIADYYRRAVKLFDLLQSGFPPLAEIGKGKSTVKKYRSVTGGHLIFRPIGLQIILQSVRLLIDNGKTLEDAVSRLSKVPWELSKAPWVGLLWNESGKRMITAKENKNAALRLIAYGAGLDLKIFKSDKASLQAELASLYNVSHDEVKLKKYV